MNPPVLPSKYHIRIFRILNLYKSELIFQHQSQVAAAVERAKTVTVAELNSILGVSFKSIAERSASSCFKHILFSINPSFQKYNSAFLVGFGLISVGDIYR